MTTPSPTTAAINFPNPLPPNAFATTQAQTSARCDDSTLPGKAPGDVPNAWSVRTSTKHFGMLAVLSTQPGDPRWGLPAGLDRAPQHRG